MITNEQACTEAARLVAASNAIIIGASNGLSISEGFNLFADDSWFRENFSDIRSRYGVRSVIEAASYPFATDEEYWGFWSRLANLKSLTESVSPTMQALAAIVGDRPCFVVTTNGEGHFPPAGFRADHVFEMEDSFTELACSAHCGAEQVPGEEAIRRMAAQERDGRVPQELLPRCERCDAVMRINMADDNRFFQTPEWTGKLAAFRNFLADHADDNVAILELGVGLRNPLVTGALTEAKNVLHDPSVVVINKGGGTGVRPDGALCIDDDITRALQTIEAAMDI